MEYEVMYESVTAVLVSAGGGVGTTLQPPIRFAGRSGLPPRVATNGCSQTEVLERAGATLASPAAHLGEPDDRLQARSLCRKRQVGFESWRLNVQALRNPPEGFATQLA